MVCRKRWQEPWERTPESRTILVMIAERLRAESVFLCMLAYYVEWHMRQALAPLLFDDEDRATAQAQRASVVAPARRSPSAQAKAATHRTSDGFTVQSFTDLLAQLGTIVKNRMRRRGAGHTETFSMTTRPNEHQRRALDLLDDIQPM